MNFNPIEKNAYLAFRSLIKNANIKLSDSSLREALWNHPDFPSFSSFSDVLSNYKVENIGVKINFEQLSSVQLPALVHFENETGGFFCTVIKINNESVWFEVDGVIKIENQNNFVNFWRGTTLLIETTDKSGEEDYKTKIFFDFLSNIRIPLIGITFAIIVLLIWNTQNKISLDGMLMLLLLKMLGVIISSLLIWQSFDANNSFLLSVCSLNKKTSCNSILQSSGAKLFDGLSWAEIGLIYFTGGLLCVLTNQKTYQFLIYFNYLAISYIFYSIYFN